MSMLKKAAVWTVGAVAVVFVGTMAIQSVRARKFVIPFGIGGA